MTQTIIFLPAKAFHWIAVTLLSLLVRHATATAAEHLPRSNK